MKTPVVLFTVCALSVVAFGLGVGPARQEPASKAAMAAAAVVAPAVAIAAPRTAALRVLPTLTVVPTREERLAAAALDEPATDHSVMLEAAVDQAADAIARPVTAALPRARLGNPFYDFGRTRRAASATE